MSDKNFKLIGKYALLLSICYLLEIIFNDYASEQNTSLEGGWDLIFYYGTYYLFSMTLNVITAVLIFQDKTKLNLNTRYVLVATLLYRPVGVIAFLLYAVYSKSNEAKEQNVSPLIPEM